MSILGSCEFPLAADKALTLPNSLGRFPYSASRWSECNRSSFTKARMEF